MHTSASLRAAFLVELLLLVAAAPALYFPHWFPFWAVPLSLALLAAGWLHRKRRLGVWLVRTPADWPLFFLFLVMLPVAVWVTPDELRTSVALPRAYILVWNFCLFWFVVSYASGSGAALHWLLHGFAGLSAFIAGLALLGMNWLYKVPVLAGALEQMPSVLTGVFRGAESGFSPNQVAGSLLYFLPLTLALLIYGRAYRSGQPGAKGRWFLLLCCVVMFGVLLLTQSRAALLGLACGLGMMAALPSRWGRRALLLGLGAVVLTMPLWLDPFIAVIGDAAPDMTIGSASTINVRFDIWRHALYGIADFPFTGLGLGAFRALVRPLYGLASVAAYYDIAHAHNIFLQTALDLGLPGLVALLAIYLAAAVQIYALWRRGSDGAESVSNPLSLPHGRGSDARAWALGFTASLVAQTVYSQLDAVTLGSKPNLLFWGLIGLVLAAANLGEGVSPQRHRVRRSGNYPTNGRSAPRATHGEDVG
jgi:putative inorganic carbon (HCO3(-)) transporter